MTSLQPFHPILIVDDELLALKSMEFSLRTNGFTNVILCSDSRDVMEIMAQQEIGAALLDIQMPDISGMELLKEIRERYPEVPVVMVTGNDDVETVVQCMRGGAYDYLVKPVDENRMLISVKRVVEYREMQSEISSLRRYVFSDTLEHPEAFSKILTRNGDMLAYFQYVEAVSRSSLPVLITGETGVGKSLVAEAVHACGALPGRFVEVGVSGLDDRAFSDALFGHVPGAFPGADQPREGAVERAAGGALFLNEIGDLTGPSQEKLLKLIQEKEYFPLGSDLPKRGEARIIAATHRDIDSLIDSGSFRNDLFFRLKTHLISLPPLRDRMDDLPLLLDYFLERAAEQFDKNKPTPPDELLTLLRNYHFPGNVRELKSMVYDAVAFHQSKMLSLDVFRKNIQRNKNSADLFFKRSAKGKTPLSYWRTLPTVRDATLLLILEAMRRTENNKTMAAQMIGITRQTLAKYLNGEYHEAEE